ncbi:BUD13 homolog [Astyanax mexicanus]|uniref:BUD13 homolog n=1 Tax=Astyanax mexicanus TaxID=7994 RepID=UPI0020CB47AC|nr:BUD13 homolog [Astyanax mexicanus]
MAASTGLSKGAALSKADYLKRYLSKDADNKADKEKKGKKKRVKAPGRGMKIVDDDIDWRQLSAKTEEENKEEEEEEEEAPVVAEIIDERPDEVQQLEAFRTSNKWRIMGATNEESQESPVSHSSSEVKGNRRVRHDSPDNSPVRRTRHDSPDLSPQRRVRHDSPDLSPKRRVRHDSPDHSPQRRIRHDSPDLSPPRLKAETSRRRHDSSSPSPPRKIMKSSSSNSQRQQSRDTSQREKHKSSSKSRASDSDLSPPRRRANARQGSDSDLSPPRKRASGRRGSDSDLSPPRKRQQGGRDSDSDLSPPRRTGSPTAKTGPRMLSGGAAGLVSVDILRKEQEENRRKEKQNQPLEEDSRNAETIFRDKSGKRRDLESERVEQRRKAGEKAEKDEKYAQWGKGLAQSQMQEQNVVDAIREAEKPLARHIDDEDLDRMLREQEREGDPMAALLRKKKEKNAKSKGIKERPRYKGPAPPPNRFNLMPGYRWDGVDRSNGFEQKRYSRIADKKAVQEEAYKWSVEDM